VQQAPVGPKSRFCAVFCRVTPKAKHHLLPLVSQHITAYHSIALSLSKECPLCFEDDRNRETRLSLRNGKVPPPFRNPSTTHGRWIHGKAPRDWSRLPLIRPFSFPQRLRWTTVLSLQNWIPLENPLLLERKRNCFRNTKYTFKFKNACRFSLRDRTIHPVASWDRYR